MKAKRIAAALLSVIVMLTAVGCNDTADSGSSAENSTAADNSSSVTEESAADSEETESSSTAQDEPDKTSNAVEVFAFYKDKVSVTDVHFISDISTVSMTAPEGATVYYSTDGSDPDTDSSVYKDPIPLELGFGDFPNCTVFRAKAVYADGSESATVTHTFFAAVDIKARFNNMIFSITGDPDDLFNAPDGIYYGKNYQKRGKESERPVYVEAIDQKGQTLFEQGAGVRIFGAASREAPIKSLKLFARKSYDPEHGKFKTDIFGTEGADGEVIDKYDKLVLRNAGNDFQFAFIRDELNQRLAEQAGYTDYEAVVPAVVYLNGKYYGLMWLHETYCDDLLKEKYGDGDGHFEVIEGGERYKKTDDDDPETAAAANEFVKLYDRFAYSDLTVGSRYDELCSVIDVENYLQNYAYNIYINNWDWPQNNYKCYRYYAAEGEDYASDGEQDGRWRFIFHDTDYCMGLYGQDVTQPNYNNLKLIMTENDERWSPLFTQLMKREDCREYFLKEITRLMNGVLSFDNIKKTLEEMNFERSSEMRVYYKHLEEMKRTDRNIWSWYQDHLQRMENIRIFASKRAENMQRFLKNQFDLSDDYFN